jgi:hypothetical protein
MTGQLIPAQRDGALLIFHAGGSRCGRVPAGRVEALAQVDLTGQAGLADEISGRFRLLCETSGSAEDFDAATGAGQRDRACTWTASSCLILAEATARRQALRRPPGR